MKIAKNTLVTINYVLHDDEGNELDSSVGKEPLKYIHGNGQLIPGLEVMLEGKEPGLKFKAIVEPEEAYGKYNDKLIVEVPRENFDERTPISVGTKFQATTDDGQVCIVHVIAINDGFITVDANHELAGKRLVFDVEILDVREATEDDFSLASACGCGCGGNCGGNCDNGGCGSCGGCA